MRVYFVCSGNTCRSPMIAGMFEDYVNSQPADKFVGSIEVLSRGLCVGDDRLSDEVVEILESNGIKFSRHTPCELNIEEFGQADYVFAVNDEIKRRIESFYGKKKNLFSLSEFVSAEVFDPYGMSKEAYETLFEIFKEAPARLYERIFKSR